MKYCKIIICLFLAFVAGCAQTQPSINVSSSISAEEQKKLENKLLRDPTNKKLRKLLIVTYIKAEKYDKARHELAKILSEHADDIDANYYMGLVYSRSGLLEEAKIYYNNVLENDPEHIPALFNLASIEIENRSPSSASRLYNKILEINPDDIETHYNLAFLYDNFFIDEKNALRHYKRCVELYSNDKPVNFDLDIIKARIQELQILERSGK